MPRRASRFMQNRSSGQAAWSTALDPRER